MAFDVTGRDKIDLQKVGKDIYEALTRTGKSGWKKRARHAGAAAIDPHKNYTPSEVASILNVSYDTAIRRMGKMGAVNMGTPERRYKRGKRMLRVTGKRLMDYLRKRSLE
jgi:hypothetical protein